MKPKSIAKKINSSLINEQLVISIGKAGFKTIRNFLGKAQDFKNWGSNKKLENKSKGSNQKPFLASVSFVHKT